MRILSAVLLLLLASGCARDVRVEEAEVQRPAWMSRLPAWAGAERVDRQSDWVVDLDFRVLVGQDAIEAIATLLDLRTDGERIITGGQRDAIETLALLEAEAEALAAPRLSVFEQQPAWLALTASAERGLRMTALVDQVSGSAARVRYEILFVRGNDPQAAGTWRLEGTRRLRVGQSLLRLQRVPDTGRSVLTAMTLRRIVPAESVAPPAEPAPTTAPASE